MPLISLGFSVKRGIRNEYMKAVSAFSLMISAPPRTSLA